MLDIVQRRVNNGSAGKVCIARPRRVLENEEATVAVQVLVLRVDRAPDRCVRARAHLLLARERFVAFVGYSIRTAVETERAIRQAHVGWGEGIRIALHFFIHFLIPLSIVDPRHGDAEKLIETPLFVFDLHLCFICYNLERCLYEARK